MKQLLFYSFLLLFVGQQTMMASGRPVTIKAYSDSSKERLKAQLISTLHLHLQQDLVDYTSNFSAKRSFRKTAKRKGNVEHQITQQLSSLFVDLGKHTQRRLSATGPRNDQELNEQLLKLCERTEQLLLLCSSAQLPKKFLKRKQGQELQDVLHTLTCVLDRSCDKAPVKYQVVRVVTLTHK